MLFCIELIYLQFSMSDVQTISLAIAIFIPILWAIAYLFDGIRRNRARVYLIFFMLAVSVTYMLVYAKFSGNIEVFSVFYPFHAGISLILFPLFYIYIISLTREPKLSVKNFRKTYIHFLIPFLFLLIFLVIQKIFMNKDEEIRFVSYLLDLNEKESSLFYVGKIIYIIAEMIFGLLGLMYFLLSLKQIRNHSRKIQDIFPDTSTKELKWIRTIFAFLVPLIVFFVIIYLMESKIVNENPVLLTISYLSFAIFFWFLGLNGFRQAEIYSLGATAVSPDHENGHLTREQFEEFIQTYHPHRSTNISLFDFCKHLQVDRIVLTKFINREFGTNFRTLINTYRIEDATEMMKEAEMNNKKTNLEELSLKLGFDSSDTFHKVFRRQTGQTPSEYFRKLKNEVL